MSYHNCYTCISAINVTTAITLTCNHNPLATNSKPITHKWERKQWGLLKCWDKDHVNVSSCSFGMVFALWQRSFELKSVFVFCPALCMMLYPVPCLIPSCLCPHCNWVAQRYFIKIHLRQRTLCMSHHLVSCNMLNIYQGSVTHFECRLVIMLSNPLSALGVFFGHDPWATTPCLCVGNTALLYTLLIWFFPN